jgi:hypothetical protein
MNVNSSMTLKAHPMLPKSKSYETRLNEDELEMDIPSGAGGGNGGRSVFLTATVASNSPRGSSENGIVERYSYYDDNLSSNVNLNYDSANYKDKHKNSAASNENNNNNNGRSANNEDNADTKIIITSFAPKPDKSRPMSHQVVNVASYRHPSSTNSLDTSLKSDNQENNP